MEKAYAFVRTGSNSYDSLSGGEMSEVYLAVTDFSSNTRSPAGSDFGTYILQQWQANHPITLGSDDNASGPIVGCHAYMVQNVVTTPQGVSITVYNPWGVDGGTTWADSPGAGLLTMTVSEIQQYFEECTVCQIVGKNPTSSGGGYSIT